MTTKRPRTGWKRFTIVHFLAYVPSFTSSVAWVPFALQRRMDALIPEDEMGAIVIDLTKSTTIVFFAVFTVMHVTGIPWIRAKDDHGQRLALWSVAAVVSISVIVGAVGWVRLLTTE